MIQVTKNGVGIQPVIIDNRVFPSLTYKRGDFKLIINKKDKGSIWFEWSGTF